MHNLWPVCINNTGDPHWFCAFTTPDGKRHFKSTGTPNKQQAQKICQGWIKAAELSGQSNLSADRARKLIDATVSDVLESSLGGTLSQSALKNFFQSAATLASQSALSRESLNKLVSDTVKQVAVAGGNPVPNATIRDCCERWLESKALDSAPRTHERYATSIARFLKLLGGKADKDLSALRPDDLIRFRDSTAQILSPASANMDLKVVRGFLYAAQKQDLVDTNVAAKVSTIKQRGENKRRAFTLEEVKNVLEKCDKAGGEWRGLVLAAVYTGQSEVRKGR